MFVACDMTGLYRSTDHGQSWSLIDSRTVQGTAQFSVAFDPATAGVVLGYHKDQARLRISSDYGLTFGDHPNPLPASAAQVTAAGYTGSGTLVVGTGTLLTGKAPGLYRLAGGWNTVQTAQGGTPIDDVLALAFSTAQPNWCFALTPTNVFWSSNDGQSWSVCSNNLNLVGPPPDHLNDLAAADDGGGVVLFALMDRSAHRLFIGAAAQPTNPPNWTNVTGNLPNLVFLDVTNAGTFRRNVALSAADSNTVYVAGRDPTRSETNYPYSTVFRGTYAGNAVTWDWAYAGFEPDPYRNLEPGWADVDDPRGPGWGFGHTPRGLVASPRNANVVALTNAAVLHRSDNGGAQPQQTPSTPPYAWQPRYTRSHGATWATTGLDITTVWHYYRHSDTLRFIASTDIGLARSTDGGDTWTWIGDSDVVPDPQNPGKYLNRGTRRANFYELAEMNGIFYAAVSNQHDIPHGTQLNLTNVPPKSGAILSSPATGPEPGLAWTTIAAATKAPPTPGLPAGPIVALIAKPPTPGVPGVLIASVWGRGVYWSDAPSQIWYQLGAFLRPNGQAVVNPLCHRLAFDSGGNLFCATAAQIQPAPIQGALWRLPAAAIPAAVRDVPAAWENKTGSLGTVSIADFAFDPVNNQHVFAGSESVQPGGQGGVFHSPDGGTTWPGGNLMPNTGPVATYHPDSLQAFSPAIIGDRLFVTTLYNGIWSSAYDRNNPAWAPQWQEFKALPFAGAHRIVSRISAGGTQSELHIGTFGAGAWELQRECLFIKDHSSVSRYEVAAQLPGQAVVTQVALLVLDGFAGAEVGVSASGLPPVKVTGVPAGQVTATLTNLKLSDPSGDLGRPQRLTMRCDLSFTDLAAFPGAPGQPNSTITLTFGEGGPYTCSTQIELVYPDHPYILDGATYWLSDGIRVFRATEDVQDPFLGVTLAKSSSSDLIPGNARTFLADALTKLNGNNGQDGAAIWQQMPTDQLTSALQIWPKDDQDRNVLNFAIAKLTYRGAIPADDVRVFFRLCSVIATGLNYDPNGAYRSFDPAGGGGPIVPRLGLTTNTGTGQLEITTIPFSNSPALLSVQDLVMGRHQCLVAEVHHRFQGGSDTLNQGDGPNTTQYLSQRNLAILGSDNPGGPDSHIVTHPFDLRGRARLGPLPGPEGPGSAGADDDGEQVDTERPDELLIW